MKLNAVMLCPAVSLNLTMILFPVLFVELLVPKVHKKVPLDPAITVAPAHPLLPLPPPVSPGNPLPKNAENIFHHCVVLVRSEIPGNATQQPAYVPVTTILKLLLLSL